MKKLYMLLLAVLALSTAYGKTLRVNNVPGNGAPYTTVDAALSAASAGDVIIIEKSNTSYGSVTITKPVTLQGEGYFLDINSPDNVGAASASLDGITVSCSDVKISSLYIGDKITIKADRVVVKRCNVSSISLSESVDKPNTPCADCIIHQNFVRYAVSSFSYNGYANNIQITNNIFPNNGIGTIGGFVNSVISRNTLYGTTNNVIKNVTNSKVMYNINGTGGIDSSNTTTCNQSRSINSNYFKNDKTLMEYERTLNLNAGAFSGNDPYVLSGIARGVRVIDLQMPESVEQGSNLQVTVKVATQR